VNVRLAKQAKISIEFELRRNVQELLGLNAEVKKYAGVAQLVERDLAKVEVESSSLFSRSKIKGKPPGFPFPSVPRFGHWRANDGAIANRLCPGLQIQLAQFDSGSRLQLSRWATPGNTAAARSSKFGLLGNFISGKENFSKHLACEKNLSIE
jgi:hypothetical protein